MTDSDASAWIEIVLGRAEELRKKGVLSIGPGSATFAPWSEPVQPDKEDRKDTTPTAPVGVLDDPASYPDGIVPGWPIERLEG